MILFSFKAFTCKGRNNPPLGGLIKIFVKAILNLSLQLPLHLRHQNNLSIHVFDLRIKFKRMICFSRYYITIHWIFAVQTP